MYISLFPNKDKDRGIERGKKKKRRKKEKEQDKRNPKRVKGERKKMNEYVWRGWFSVKSFKVYKYSFVSYINVWNSHTGGNFSVYKISTLVQINLLGIFFILVKNNNSGEEIEGNKLIMATFAFGTQEYLYQ